ncbi:MAG: hypothetical protein JWP63_1150 [Candidatus Solibacter sp.]|nr:hypothetical protein [Candidatus Solibacter sp.]
MGLRQPKAMKNRAPNPSRDRDSRYGERGSGGRVTTAP